MQVTGSLATNQLFWVIFGVSWYMVWHEWPFFTALYYLMQASMSIGTVLMCAEGDALSMTTCCHRIASLWSQCPARLDEVSWCISLRKFGAALSALDSRHERSLSLVWSFPDYASACHASLCRCSPCSRLWVSV